MKILDDGVSILDSLEEAYVTNFPYPSLSAASADFTATLDVTSATNGKALKAVTTTLDAIDSMSQDAQTLETFVHLHIPQMEDGGNFGVSIQLALVKQISDLQEATKKSIEDLAGYAGARADAIDKLKLPSASSSITKSTSTSTTDGKKEDKTSESTEEKTTTNDGPGTSGYDSRVAALVAVDMLYYAKAKRAYQSTMTLYVATLDFLDKNKEKLTKPKGNEGSSRGYSSMY